MSIKWRLWPLHPIPGGLWSKAFRPLGSAIDVIVRNRKKSNETNGISPGFIRVPSGKSTGIAESLRLRHTYPVSCYSTSSNSYHQFINSKQSVFLEQGGQYPAAVLRQPPYAGKIYKVKWHHLANRRFLLKRSGDIESNPGPKSKDPQKCDSCQTTVSKSSFHKCQDCNAVCHKKKECSDINRGMDRPWWCKIHRDESIPTNDERISCSVCEKTIRCTSTPLKCPDCDALCHRYFNCSRIPTYNKELIWKCKDHSDGENNKSQCHKSKGNFSKSYIPLKCQQCDLHCHKQTKCSDIPKGTRFPIWNCGNHGEEEPSPDPALQYPICVTCNIAVSATNPLKCQDCERVCHRWLRCRGIKRNPRTMAWMDFGTVEITNTTPVPNVSNTTVL